MARQPMRLGPDDVRYDVSDPDGKYTCGSCRMFVPGEVRDDGEDWGLCTGVGIDGDENGRQISGAVGSCGYYTYEDGRNATEAEINEIRLSKGMASYMEHAPGYGCGRCRFFAGEEQPCDIVAAPITALGCCQQWDAPEARHFRPRSENTGSNRVPRKEARPASLWGALRSISV